MSEDPIVNELHELRQKHAKKFNYDFWAVFNDFKKKGEKRQRNVVSLPIKRKESAETNS